MFGICGISWQFHLTVDFRLAYPGSRVPKNLARCGFGLNMRPPAGENDRRVFQASGMLSGRFPYSIRGSMPGDSGLSALSRQTNTRTGESDPVQAGFYRPCLLNSHEYRRAVGYFRSSVYLVVGPATVEFRPTWRKIRPSAPRSWRARTQETIVGPTWLVESASRRLYRTR